MELQEIRVIIDKDGQVKLDVNGVKGMDCLDLTRELEQALGGEVEREMKPDAYEQQVDQSDQDWLQNG